MRAVPVSIRGLTMWQPMAWAVGDGHKRVENRPWAPWKGVTHIAIHAGAKYHREHAEQIAEHIGLDVPDRADLVFGAIIAVVPLLGYIHSDDHESCRTGWTYESPWFSGPFGWVLGEVVKLETPIKRRGAQGLWYLDDDELNTLRTQGAHPGEMVR